MIHLVKSGYMHATWDIESKNKALVRLFVKSR